MNALLLSIVIAALGGIAIGVQNPLASGMGQRLGIMESVFIIHLGGAIIAGVPLLLARGGGLGGWRDVPWYALLAGGLGVALVAAVSFVIPRLGVAATVALVVAAQLTVSALVDHFGWLGVPVRPLDAVRLGGAALLLAGGWLVLR